MGLGSVAPAVFGAIMGSRSDTVFGSLTLAAIAWFVVAMPWPSSGFRIPVEKRNVDGDEACALAHHSPFPIRRRCGLA